MLIQELLFYFRHVSFIMTIFFSFQECLKQKITLKLYKWSFFSQVYKDCFESQILISTLFVATMFVVSVPRAIAENVSNSLFSNVLRFLIRVRDKFHCFLKSSYIISFLNVKIMDKLFCAFTMPRSSVTFSYVECTCFDSFHKS